MVVKFQSPFKGRSSRGNLLLLLCSATGLDVQKYADLPKLVLDVGDAKGHTEQVMLVDAGLQVRFCFLFSVLR